jgi:hypothetical protein
MPVMMKRATVATGATNSNLLAGSAFEFMRGNVYLSIGIVADVASAKFTIFSGSDLICEESDAPVKAANTYPVIPDDMYFNDVATLADRLVLALRNTNAGNAVYSATVQVTNLG